MQFQPTPALAVFLTLGAVPSGAGAQAPVVDSVACYTVHYDSARNGASPDLFPDHFVLLGRERGRVVPLDSTGFWRTPRSMADWYRHTRSALHCSRREAGRGPVRAHTNRGQ